MECHLFVIFMCELVLSTLGHGCVKYTFSQDELSSCRRKEIAYSRAKMVHTPQLDSYDEWKVHSYISDSKIAPFDGNSTTYIAPSQPYEKSCSSFTLRLLSGSQLYVNIFMGAFPQSILYMKIFEMGKDRIVADWSNIRNSGWKELRWSTIEIPVPNVNSPTVKDYSIMVVGILRETGILMIDSIGYIASEFDGDCKMQKQKKKRNHEDVISDKLNILPVKTGPNKYIRISKPLVNAPCVFNGNCGSRNFFNVREENQIERAKNVQFQGQGVKKCDICEQRWRQESGTIMEYVNKDLNKCNENYESLADLYQQRTSVLPHFEENYSNLTLNHAVIAARMKQAEQIANNSVNEIIPAQVMLDFLKNKLGKENKTLSNLTSEVPIAIDKINQLTQALDLKAQTNADIDITIENKTRELQSLKLPLELQLDKRDNAEYLVYLEKSKRETQVDKVKQDCESIKIKIHSTKEVILGLENDIIKFKIQLLEGIRIEKEQQDELFNLKDDIMELQKGYEVSDIRDGNNRKKLRIQKLDEDLNQFRRNIITNRMICAFRENSMKHKESELTTEKEKTPVLENKRENLTNVIIKCFDNLTRLQELLDSEKKETDNLTNNYVKQMEIQNEEHAKNMQNLSEGIHELIKQHKISMDSLNDNITHLLANSLEELSDIKHKIDSHKREARLAKHLWEMCQNEKKDYELDQQHENNDLIILRERIEKSKREAIEEAKRKGEIYKEIERNERKRYDELIKQCNQTTKSIKNIKTKQILRSGNEMHFWCALIMILVVTTMLIFAITFYLSKISNVRI